MNQYDYDLAYLTRQREETLVKLAKIEEKIQKLRGPPKSFWSTHGEDVLQQDVLQFRRLHSTSLHQTDTRLNQSW